MNKVYIFNSLLWLADILLMGIAYYENHFSNIPSWMFIDLRGGWGIVILIAVTLFVMLKTAPSKIFKPMEY